jgi:hypothetical protein
MRIPPLRFTSPPVLAALLLAVSASAADISTLSGKKYKGDVSSITPEVITFRTDVGQVGVAVKEMFLVDFGSKPASPDRFDEIELTDGSVVRCSQFRIKNKAAEAELLAAKDGPKAPKLTLGMESLFTYLRGANDAKTRERWKETVALRGKRDQFVVRRGEMFEPVAGTVIEGDAEGDAITFEKESGERTSYKLIRASGLIFNQPPRGVIPPTVCKVSDAFGNTLTAAKLDLAEGRLTVTTVAGAVFEYESLKGVAKLDFSQGNVAFLSDLEAQVSAPPAVPGEPHFTYLRDKTNENAALKIDGQTFGKGLWVFPDTTLTYKLNGDYREFKAVVGVDEAVQVASSAVKLTIEADGKVVFAEVVSRKDKARPLTLDVKGVKQLKIGVEREGLYLGNQIDLAEARLQK